MLGSALRYSLRSLVVLCCLSSFAYAVIWQGTLAGQPAWVTIVPRGHTITAETMASEPWWEWGDTASDVFMFAFDTPDNIRLALDFSTLADGRAQARLYLARDTEPLSHVTERNRFYIVREEGSVMRIRHPDYLFETRSGPWREDGYPNYNLTIWYEGIDASVTSDPDGEFDRRMEVGSNTPGVPEWQTQRLLVDPYPSRAYNRFGAALRMPSAPPYVAGEPTIPSFPYLKIATRPGDGVVPFLFNPDTYQLRQTLFTGFHSAGSYQINSTALPPHVNFETPFVFSNFDDDRDHEMVMRGHINVREGHLGADSRQMTSNNRQSWKVGNSGRWRFGLHFTGFHKYEDTVSIGNESFYSVEGERFAEWVNSRPWPQITFVEATEEYPGSEGIYFYNPADAAWLSGEVTENPENTRQPFLTASDRLSVESARGLPPNYRGEFIEGVGSSATLYKSPVDNRVHLYNANGGIWHLDNGLIIRMHNTDGDPFIEGWTQELVRPSEEELAASENGEIFAMRAVGGTHLASLYLSSGYALYWDDSKLVIRQTDMPLSNGFLEPPTDKASWELFREQSAAYLGQNRNAYDLEQWLESMPGSTASLEDVAVSDYRIIDTGFRFLLSVSENITLGGNLAIPSLQSVSAGEYVVEYDAETDRWSIEPAVRAELIFELATATLTELQPQELNVSIINPGDVDQEVSFCLVIEDYVVTEDYEIECVSHLSVFGRETLEHSFVVTPVETENMTISVVDDGLDDGERHTTQTFPVERIERITVSKALQLSTKNSLPITAVASLIFVGAIWGLTRSLRRL